MAEYIVFIYDGMEKKKEMELRLASGWSRPTQEIKQNKLTKSIKENHRKQTSQNQRKQMTTS